MFQQPAKSLLALHLAWPKVINGIGRLCDPPWQIVFGKMRQLAVIVSDELGNDVPQVRLTEDDEAVEAFLFDRLNERLGVGIVIQRPDGRGLRNPPVLRHPPPGPSGAEWQGPQPGLPEGLDCHRVGRLFIC